MGEILPGEQPAILDRDLFEAVQLKLRKWQPITPSRGSNPRPCCLAASLTTVAIA